MDFKTEIDESDIAWAVAPQIQRMGLEIGSDQDSKGEPQHDQILHCPYCDHSAEASEMLTGETVRYLHRFMEREVIFPMMNNMFSGLDNEGGQSGGFISVRIEHHRSFYPPRPIHGPEPPDMKIIEFLCCGKKAKIAEGWDLISQCIYCGISVILV